MVEDQTLTSIIIVVKHLPLWFPGSGFRTHASKAAEKRMKMVDDSFNEAQTSAVRRSAFLMCN